MISDILDPYVWASTIRRLMAALDPVGPALVFIVIFYLVLFTFIFAVATDGK